MIKRYSEKPFVLNAGDAATSNMHTPVFSSRLIDAMNKFYTSLLLTFLLFIGGNVFGQTTYSWTGASSNAWLTTGNWSPATVPGNKSTTTNNDIAYFNTNTQVVSNINMNTQVGTHYMGAFNFGTSATSARTVGNSSTTVSGVFYLNGVSLNGVANTIIWNQSTGTHTFSNVNGCGINLKNTTNNIIQITNSGGVNISSVISGGNLTKAGTGAGVLTLSAVNTYTGSTTITAGELRLNPSANNSLSGACIFNGGTLATTGITASRAITFGSIDLSDNSTLALASSTAHTVTFTSAGTFTSGKTLTITGWSGTYGAGTAGTGGRVYVGSSSSSLTCTQLGQIRFYNGTSYFPAALLSTGELVPVNTPTTTSISPSTAVEGSAGFTITVNGTNFISGLSVVTWGGSALSTTYVSSTQLTATVPAGNIASAGTANVGVSNFCTASNTQTFTITAACTPPTPTFSSAPSGSVCTGTDVTYTTQSGKSAYVWSLPGTLGTNYSITSGGIGSTDNTVTLKWLTPGSKTVTVGYTDGCASVTPASNTITAVNTATSIAPATIQNIPVSTNGTLLTVTEGYTPASREWKYSTTAGGPYTTGTGSTGTTYYPNFGTPGTYFVVCETNYGSPCSATVTSNEVQVNVISNSITLSPATQAKGPYCNATSNSISLDYTTTGTVTAPFLQLSNASGSFASGTTNLGGSISGSGPYTITGSIPSAQTAGTLYRVRIVSTDVIPVISSDNNSNITITAASTPTVGISSLPSAAAGITTICAGTSVTFTAVPANTGGGTVAYQWKKNGTNVGTNINTYTDVTLASGDYVSCDITVTGACVTSTTASTGNIFMTVNLNPATPSNPTAAANPACGSTTLNTMSAPGGETYYWQGTNASGTSTASSTASTYAVSSTATYYVRSQSTAGCWSSGSGSLAVTVNTAISIGTSPANQTVTEPATATFSVSGVTGTVSGYQWQLNSGSGWGDISGANAASYTTGATSTAMSGFQYRCVVKGTSPCADVTSGSATLTVNAGVCHSEDFSGLGTIAAYGSGSWSGTGGTWTATDARGDQTINGKAITIRTGVVTSPTFTDGISSITLTTKFPFSESGTTKNLTVEVNGTVVGTVLQTEMTGTTPITKTFSGINVSGSIVITLTSASGARYCIDDVNWICYAACTPPSTSASSLTFSNPTSSSLGLNFTRGNGDSVLIIAKAGSASTAPTSGTPYNLGDAVGGGTVVYKGLGSGINAATTQTIGSLSAETEYYFAIYEYGAATKCYQTAALTGNRYTLSTEPTAQPTSGFSSTTCTANSIDLTIPAPSAGADGYIVLQKSGSAPTGLPTDANSYSVSNTIGDATVAAIVTSAGTYTITGLSAGTNYYFQLVPYNANSGAVAQTYNYLTGGTLLQTNFSTLVTGTSTASTVETDATYSYTQNIAYASYQSTPVPASAGSSVGVHNIIIKDGGATTDADALPTILTGISYSYSGTANTVRAAALFTTTGSKVADGTVGANSITFTGMSGSNVTTNDNNSGGAKELILRVTFNTTVTDNQKLVFTVTSVTGGAICSYSQFAAANGGGAISENTGTDDNRIEVVADRIVFGTQPITSSVNTNIPSFTIRFQDANGNLDFDNNRTVTLTATDGGVNMSAAASYSITATHTGIVTFSDVQFTSAPQTAITITASTTGLASSNTVKSNPFDIFDIPVGSYKTTTDGVWSSSAGNNTITWQELTGSGWTTMISPSYPSTATTNRVYIFNNVTLNGTNTAKNIIVESTGTLSTSTVTPTFKNLLIKTGGVFNKNPGNGLKFDSDGVLEVEDGATFNYSHTNATSRSTNLWNGTEKFHPKSNFVVKETDNSVGSGNQVVESASDVSSYNGAKFGNFIVDMGSAGGKVPLFVSGLSTKLTNGDFILRTGSDNGMIFNSGDYTDTIGGNLIIESTYTQPFTLTNSASTVNFTVNDNVVHNGTAEFRLANSQTTNNPSVTLNIDSNLVIGTSNFNFDIGTSSTGSNKSIVNLKGDLTVGTGNILTQNTATAKKGEFNFTGTYNSSDSTTIQTVDVASTGATTENARVNFNVKSGAYTQLINRDFEIGTNSKLTVETGSIFDFGFSGTTALNVAISASQTGAAFESKQASTLKITSIDGLYGNWNTTVFPSVTQTTGNLRLSKSNRTIDNLATFWYIGKQNQQTGDGPNANNSAGTYSSTPDGKVVICELANNSLTLTPSLSFGFTSNTSVNSTYGGHLYIKKGQFRETTSAFVFSGGGTLRMEPGTYYYIPKGNANLAASDADPIPRMSGLIHPTSQYYLNGGTIELAGTGGSDGYQSLRGNTINPKNYINVTFSGANVSGTDYKNLTSTVVIDSALTITGDAIVECHGLSLTTPQSFTGPGGLVMSGANSRIRIRKLAVEQPELTGYNVDYALTGGTVEFYSSGATQQQLMRGNFTTSSGTTKLVDYYNIDINADAANWSTTSTFADAGNVNMASSCKLTGTLNVNAPAVFRMDKTDAISNGTGSSQVINIKDYAGLLYGSPNGIKNSGTGTSDGNFRTSGTRNFSSKASYGFISSGDMVTGNGLPATVNGLYVYKFDPTDKVTLTATVRADSILKMSSGHIITGSSFFVELGKDVSNRGTLDYNTGYVVGKMRRWYNGTNSGIASGLFPLGEDVSGTLRNRKYLIEFSSAPTSGGYLDVNFNHVDMGMAGLPIAGIPAVGSCSTFDVTTTEDEGYWIGTPQSSTLGDGAYALSLTGENFSTVTDLCQLTLLKRVGTGNWTAPGDHEIVTGSISEPTVKRSNISGFSNFGFGGGAPNPLPVELTSFSGVCVEDGISQISWSTASEFNSKEFIVQRSEDGIRYKNIAAVPSAGNSDSPKHYSIKDTAASANSSYYRLVQVDYDGRQTIYSFIQVRCGEVSYSNIFYAQPSIVVEISADKNKEIGFNVYEISGRLIHHENKQIARGFNRFDLNLQKKLANGIYIIQMVDGDDVSSTKLMVH